MKAIDGKDERRVVIKAFQNISWRTEKGLFCICCSFKSDKESEICRCRAISWSYINVTVSPVRHAASASALQGVHAEGQGRRGLYSLSRWWSWAGLSEENSVLKELHDACREEHMDLLRQIRNSSLEFFEPSAACKRTDPPSLLKLDLHCELILKVKGWSWCVSDESKGNFGVWKKS